MGREVSVEDGIRYIDSLSTEEINDINSILGLSTSEGLSKKDIIFRLINKCKEQEEEIREQKNDLDRATKLVEQAVIKQKELCRLLENSNRLGEYTIAEAGRLLGDFDLETKLNTGQITVDKILANIIDKANKSQAGLQRFTKQRLQACGYQLKEDDGADTVICNLLMKIEAAKKKVDAMQSQLNVAHCKNEMNTISDNTLIMLEQSLPKQFDAQTMSLQRDQQMLDVNMIIASLIQTVESMKNTLIQCKKEMSVINTKSRNNVTNNKKANQNSERDLMICRLYSEGQTQEEIAQTLGVSRGTVYNVIKKQRQG